MRPVFALLLAAGLAFQTLSSPAAAAAPEEAAQLVGRTTTIEGIVSQVASSRGTTFINMGGRYPNQSFYAVIFSDYAYLFPDAGSLEGRAVAISGEVTLHKGRPQVILMTADQLQVR